MAMPRTAAIYFHRNSGEVAKGLADRARSTPTEDGHSGLKTILVWGHQFRDEQSIESMAGVVLIQRSLPNSEFIAKVYSQFAANVEIHYFDDEGTLEAEAEDGTQPETEAPAPEVDQPPSGPEPVQSEAAPAEDEGPDGDTPSAAPDA